MYRKGKGVVGEISARGNVWSGKCPVGQIPAQANVWSGKCQVGEVSVGEMSSRGSVQTAAPDDLRVNFVEI